MKALVCENVTKVYPGRRPYRAVDGVSLRLGPGETFALVGESGCGKTTLARMIVRLLPPTSGRIQVDGADVWSLRGAGLGDFRRRVQIVFQDPGSALDPRQSVFDAVEEPLVLHSPGAGGRRRRRERVEWLLGKVGLGPDEGRRFPHQLSGGQKQRVFIARALALGPRLLILDEPVSALDVSVRGQVLNLLAGLQGEFGLSYFLISHDLAVVRQVAGRVAVMHRGRLVEMGPVREVWARPAHPYTLDLLRAFPVPDPARRGPPPGEPPPELAETPAGARPGSCLYEPRCGAAEGICRRRRPGLEPAGGSEAHLVACHFPTPTSAGQWWI